MNILSSFCHPRVVPNLYGFLFFCKTQEMIFWKKKKWKKIVDTIKVPTDFYSLDKNIWNIL